MRHNWAETSNFLSSFPLDGLHLQRGRKKDAKCLAFSEIVKDAKTPKNVT